ncbi:MAG: hydroxylamine reductase [Clostridium sp.]
MDTPMFCYQCEQTVGGKGCTRVGVCGKSPEVAGLQDLLIYQLEGISCLAKQILDNGGKVDVKFSKFIEDCLFTTLTNVNFDADVHVELLKESQSLKDELKSLEGNIEKVADREQVTYELSNEKSRMLEDAKMARLDRDSGEDPDVKSVKHTILYGLKGISAYGHQARFLKYNSEEVDEFYFKGLAAITDKSMDLNAIIELMKKTGEIALEIMKVLDDANTTIYKHPTPTKVNVNTKKGPFVIISGHDLKDLEILLKQAKEKGVNVYTHGEMLPAHGYPELKKYDNLIGNFGSAWQNQQKEFDNIPGAILMTTNCIMKPRDSYKDRIYTTNVVGWDGVKHVGKLPNGEKDFSEMLDRAIELGGFTEDEEVKEIIVGFGHDATLKNAGAIVEGVKNGDIKHFFVIGGCDGAKPGRNYYTEFAQKVPKDCIILTLACGKYRFNKLEFGDIGGIPRLLDVGQCNDVYSATRIALALSDAFQTDVNSLPLSIVLSWYEQKAVADLLALLSLGIKGMLLGPSLPAFITPNVLQFLVDNFNIRPIETAEEDLKRLLQARI